MSEMKDKVMSVVDKHWPEFEKSHPALAAELDRDDYVAATVHQLRLEPEYSQTIQRGQSAAAAAEAVAKVIDRVVRTVMRI